MKVYVCTNDLDIENEVKAIFLIEKDALQFKKDSDWSEFRTKIAEHEVIE